MILIIFGIIVGQLVTSQISFDDCKARNFEPKACAVQKEIFKASESKIFHKK